MKVVIYLGEALQKRGMTQKELHQVTGISEELISKIVNNEVTSMHTDHMNLIVNALNLKNITELIDFEE